MFLLSASPAPPARRPRYFLHFRYVGAKVGVVRDPSRSRDPVGITRRGRSVDRTLPPEIKGRTHMPYDLLIQAWNTVFTAISGPLAGSLDPLTASIEAP